MKSHNKHIHLRGKPLERLDVIVYFRSLKHYIICMIVLPNGANKPLLYLSEITKIFGHTHTDRKRKVVIKPPWIHKIRNSEAKTPPPVVRTNQHSTPTHSCPLETNTPQKSMLLFATWQEDPVENALTQRPISLSLHFIFRVTRLMSCCASSCNLSASYGD